MEEKAHKRVYIHIKDNKYKDEEGNIYSKYVRLSLATGKQIIQYVKHRYRSKKKDIDPKYDKFLHTFKGDITKLIREFKPNVLTMCKIKIFILRAIEDEMKNVATDDIENARKL